MPAVKSKGAQAKPIEFREENGCFICTSHARDWDGYPLLKRSGKMQRISRYIYEECYGFIDENQVVRHKCDNASCINPEHLVAGTHKENSMDMVLRGRSARGEKKGVSKLKEDDIRQIRNLSKTMSKRQIAMKYDIHVRTVYKIVDREVWKHI
ncbi:HNH endonuclease [Oceanobacillus oncorhynchi subsp. oncorhynchi]|uniref:HNH endonuclease signature motif containing protein n=1 Tax=Oceanobacillus oncorhynchi TaxID=545501 RepID=UPI00362E6389